MNKFLRKLKDRLMILSDEEREDIINEYKANIEEKIKNGKTESEAVEDFGDIDDLADEILSAYKINPKYNKKEEGPQNFNEAIKKASSKIAEFTDKVVDKVKINNENITLEKVFEIILKVIVLLIALLLLKIPFVIIGSLMGNILSFGVFDIFSYNFIKLLFNILYIVVCIVIIIIAAKRYTDSVTYKDEKIQDAVDKMEEKKENKEKKTKKSKVETIEKEEHILIKIIKIFVIIVFMIPILFSIIGLVIALVFMAYLTIKCISLLGPTLIVLGVLCLFSFFFDIIYSLTIRKKRFCLFNLFSCVIFMSVGVILSFNTYMNIRYIDEAPEGIETNIKTKTETIDNILYFEDDYNNVTIKIDNELEDNNVVIDVISYEGYSKYDLKNVEIDNIYYLDKERVINEDIKKLINTVIDNIGEGKVYNYSKLFDSNIIIKVNANTSDKIIIK